MHGGKAGRPPIHGRYSHAAVEQRREAKKLARALKLIMRGRYSKLDPGPETSLIFYWGHSNLTGDA